MSLKQLNMVLMNTSAIMHTMTVPVPAPNYDREEEVSVWDHLQATAGKLKEYVEPPPQPEGHHVTYVSRAMYETIAEQAPEQLQYFAPVPEIET